MQIIKFSKFASTIYAAKFVLFTLEYNTQIERSSITCGGVRIFSIGSTTNNPKYINNPNYNNNLIIPRITTTTSLLVSNNPCYNNNHSYDNNPDDDNNPIYNSNNFSTITIFLQ